MALSLLLGVIIGIVLGLTGAGGGILAVPALVFAMGWTMQQAAPVALIAVAVGAAIGAIEGLKAGLVRYQAAIIIALAGIPFTSLGILTANLLPQHWLMILFSIIMIFVAGRMLSKPKPAGETMTTFQQLCGIDPVSGRFQWSWTAAGIFSGIGAITSFLTGLLGVGGGFVIVPLLRTLTSLSMQSIVATSLMVIALVGSGGVVSNLLYGGVLPMPTTLYFTIAVVIGLVIGRKLISYLSDKIVQQLFATVLLFISLTMMIRAIVSF